MRNLSAKFVILSIFAISACHNGIAYDQLVRQKKGFEELIHRAPSYCELVGALKFNKVNFTEIAGPDLHAANYPSSIQKAPKEATMRIIFFLVEDSDKIVRGGFRFVIDFDESSSIVKKQINQYNYGP